MATSLSDTHALTGFQEAELIYSSQRKCLANFTNWCTTDEQLHTPDGSPASASLETLWTWSREVRQHSELMQYALRVSPRIFIAGLLHESCAIAAGWVREVLKLALLFAADRSDFGAVFVSIGESGSHDCTASVLREFRAILAMLGVPHHIRTGPGARPSGDLAIRRPGQHRIDFLQRMRNEMLAPLLRHTGQPFDNVVFLSDTEFCSSDVVRLLRHDRASIKCGLDFDQPHGWPEFYDTWVARDISGRSLNKQHPYVTDAPSAELLKAKQPFQVSCCWNGLTILESSAFVDFGLRFRRSLQPGECHAAETEIICHDFAASGRPNVLIEPRVRLGYTRRTSFNINANRTGFSDRLASAASVTSWMPLPKTSECMDMEGSNLYPGRARIWNWYESYRKLGVPVAPSRQITLHNCSSNTASSCRLRHGCKHVAVTLAPEHVSNASKIVPRPLPGKIRRGTPGTPSAVLRMPWQSRMNERNLTRPRTGVFDSGTPNLGLRANAYASHVATRQGRLPAPPTHVRGSVRRSTPSSSTPHSFDARAPGWGV